MSTFGTNQRLAWVDRWSEPSLEQLLQPYDEIPQALLKSLIDRVQELGQVEHSLVWYGSAWKWTVQFKIHDDVDEQVQIMAYLVPNPEDPQICVPLRDHIVSQFPMKRLHKFIRDGIRQAKRAVEIYWARWSISNQSEVDQLVDLLKRTHKVLQADRSSPTASEPN